MRNVSLTELAKSLLVALACNNLVLLSLSFLSNLLDGCNPAPTLGGILRVKLVLVAVKLEGEFTSTGLLDFFSISLREALVHFIRQISCQPCLKPYQVQGTTGCSLVLAMLVEEEQALSGLASPGGSGMGSVLALCEVRLELCWLNGILTKPEEHLLWWQWKNFTNDRRNVSPCLELAMDTKTLAYVKKLPGAW